MVPFCFVFIFQKFPGEQERHLVVIQAILSLEGFKIIDLVSRNS